MQQALKAIWCDVTPPREYVVLNPEVFQHPERLFGFVIDRFHHRIQTDTGLIPVIAIARMDIFILGRLRSL